MCVSASVYLGKEIRRDAQYHATDRRDITFPAKLKRVKFVMKGGVVYRNDVH
jgi:hypothetical protein